MSDKSDPTRPTAGQLQAQLNDPIEAHEAALAAPAAWLYLRDDGVRIYYDERPIGPFIDQSRLTPLYRRDFPKGGEMSDKIETPRTDAAELNGLAVGGIKYVRGSLARQLERELAEKEAALKTAEEIIGHSPVTYLEMKKRAEQAEAERDELKRLLHSIANSIKGSKC